MSDMPERIWIDPGAMEIVLKKHEPHYDVLFVRADIARAEAEAMVRAEREACAKRAHNTSIWHDGGGKPPEGWEQGARDAINAIAAAIRARGDK